MIDGAGSIDWLIAAAARNVSAEWPFYAALGVALALVVPGRLAAQAASRSRHVRTDMAYALLELTHLEALLVLAPVAAGLHAVVASNAPWLPLGAVQALPIWLKLIVVLVSADFAAYWLHRLKHRNAWLWQFHKVHHSQSELSVFTRFRFPLLDRLLDLVLLFPVGVLTGSATLPLALYLIIALRSCLEHSRQDWTYGAIGRLVVSPSFHCTHHSRAPEHLDRNFGSFLAIWDHLFGTYAPRGNQQLRYGLHHETIRQDFVFGQIAPVVGLWRMLRERSGTHAALHTATEKSA